MKKIMFMLSIMLTLAIGGVAAATVSPAVGGLIVAGALAGPQGGGLKMAVTPEIWTDYIIGNLFKNNEYLMQSVDESQYVIGAGVVHIPQAGAPSAVKKNRSSLPATITRRNDTDVTYVLDELTTDPRFIPDADKAELSYDKMQSCMMEDMAALQQVAADSMLYRWRPKYFIKATGTKSANNLVYGTGLRTGVTYEDFKTAKAVMDKWGVPKEGRCVILSEEMYQQLTSNIINSTSDNLSAIYNPATGELQKVEGFQVYHRSTVLAASNSSLTAVSGKKYYEFSGGTDLTYTDDKLNEIDGGGTADATACVYGLFWHPTMVARAVGMTKMFTKDGDPQYYGDVYSFLQRLGGRARRADGVGVLGIIQEYHAS